MPKTEHVHKYKRHTFKSGNEVYFCALPDCNKKIAPAFALGKKCICWRCGNEFILTDYSIRLARPHCDVCHRPKNGIIHEEPPMTLKESLEIMETHDAPSLNPLSSLSQRLAALSQASDDEDI